MLFRFKKEVRLLVSLCLVALLVGCNFSSVFGGNDDKDSLIEYQLEVVVNGSGKILVNDKTEISDTKVFSFEKEETVLLKAISDENSNFVAWNGAGYNNFKEGEISIFMTANQTITADFEDESTGGINIEVTSDDVVVPSNLDVIKTLTGVKLSWSGESDSYMVYRSASKIGIKVPLTKQRVSDSTYIDTDVELNQSFWYWVVAYEIDKGYSYLSEPVNILIEEVENN